MKNIITALISFLYLPLLAQVNSGQVLYKVSYVLNEKQTKNDKIEDYTRLTKEKADAITYTLNFNKTQSTFKYNRILNGGEGNESDIVYSKIALVLIGDYDYYLDVENKNSIYNYLNHNMLIKEDYNKISWNITNESKTIDGYICYKATYDMPIPGKTNKRPITVWFTPSIPFSYGPQNLSGLPGLILELQQPNAVLYAATINLSKENITIEFPKGKSISYDEFADKILKSGF